MQSALVRVARNSSEHRNYAAVTHMICTMFCELLMRIGLIVLVRLEERSSFQDSLINKQHKEQHMSDILADQEHGSPLS